jgi:cell division protein ZapA (FtsZ GTPase activity inhibitor)
MAQERRRETRSFQEQAYSNMLTLNALVELLSEKGLLDKREILDRVKKLQTEVRAKRKPN